MIRKSSLFVKMLFIKNSAWKMVNDSMPQVNPSLETCPECQQKQRMCVHAYYSRTIIDFINGEVVSHKVNILRLSCQCGHTHAVLFDVLIPYERHSLFFILRVLAEYFLHLSSIEKLCERFYITQKRLYSWIKKWNADKTTWLGVLKSQEISNFSFLKSLVSMQSYSSFSADFVRNSSVSFLQTHANPHTAHYAQRVFTPDYSFSYTTRLLP